MKRTIRTMALFASALIATVFLAWGTARVAGHLLLPELPAGSERETEAVMLLPPETQPGTIAPETTLPPVETTVPEETTLPEIYHFTEEEERLLLKIGMAERGEAGCTECIALVMRTVLNRVESPRFSSSIRGVIYAQDQFTPVADGTFEEVQPNERCYEALEMIRGGWDESQGALYYEWCEGESWHSQNLKLLFQHCDTRFYQ